MAERHNGRHHFGAQLARSPALGTGGHNRFAAAAVIRFDRNAVVDRHSVVLRCSGGAQLVRAHMLGQRRYGFERACTDVAQVDGIRPMLRVPMVGQRVFVVEADGGEWAHLR